MKTMLVQRVSANAARVETNYIIWMLSVASVILFILTVKSLTITELEPYGFFYMRILPVFYWAGVATSIAAIAVSLLYDQRRKNDYRLIPVLLLALFLYGVPVFSYEVPRFTDIFSHGSESIPIIDGGQVDPNDRYAKEYPGAFILLAISSIVQGADPLTLIRFTELFTALTVTALVYSVARVSNSKFAVLAPLGFMGAFWVDQGHYSPQGLALIFYMVFFLALTKAMTSTGSRRGWLALGIFMTFAINLSSPTNSLFLILNLVTIAAVSLLVFRKRSMVSNRILVFTALAGVLFLAWSVYNADTKTVKKWEDFQQILERDLGTSNVKITPSPSASYQAINSLRTAVVGFVLVSGAAMSVLVLRKNKSYMNIIFVGWFATASFITISMYLSPVLLSRNFMYVTMPWGVITTLFFSQGIGVRKAMLGKGVVFAGIVLLIIAIPATRYGRDPTTYAPSSMLNSAETLADASAGHERVISYFMGSLVTKYFAALDGIRMEYMSFDNVFQSSYLNNKPAQTQEWLDSQSVVNSRVFFSDPERNNIVMKYDQPQLYEDLEKGVQQDHNLIINNGASRVYSSTIASAPQDDTSKPAGAQEAQQK